MKCKPLFLSFIASCLLIGCKSGDDNSGGASTNVDNEIISIRIENVPSSLAKGQKVQLVAFGQLASGKDIQLSNKDITWAADNTEVVNFFYPAEVVAVGEGNTEIKASYSSYSERFNITVTPPIVEGIEIYPSNLSLVSGFSNNFSAYFVNSDKTTTPITNFETLTSSDPQVATVNNNIINGVGAGNAVISLKAVDPAGNSYSGEINVDVREVALTSIRLPSSKVMLGTRTNKAIEVTGYFDDGSAYNISNHVTLISTVPDVVSVNQNKITGLKIGTSKLTATYGDISSDPMDVYVNNIDIVSSLRAFAAIKSDRSIMTWGTAMYGGYSVEIADQLINVKTLIANQFGFAALRDDNTILSWGTLWDAGQYFYYQNIKEIVTTKDGWAFAALTLDGKVVSWGHNAHGGDPSAVYDQLVDVEKIYPGSSAFVAEKKDGTVLTWGHPQFGGDSSKVKDKLNNVKDIAANSFGFAALKNDGTVVTWGDPEFGGDTTSVNAQLNSVKALYFNNVSFAALKNDGTVVTWGDAYRGGDSSKVQNKLTDVKQIYSNPYAYVALKNDGSAVVWGLKLNGGDSSEVQSKLNNLKTVYSTHAAFAAIDNNGKVITWGDPYLGGDSSLVAEELVNVDKIASTVTAFAALKKDGTVVTWGDAEFGGDSSKVTNELYDIIDIFGSYDGAFAAVRKDGVLITWGKPEAGGGATGSDLFIYPATNAD